MSQQFLKKFSRKISFFAKFFFVISDKVYRARKFVKVIDMNFTAVRGFNAYAQFTAKIRESVKMHEDVKEQTQKDKQVSSTFEDPIDIVDISKTARHLSLNLVAERESAQTTLREWIKETGTMSGVLTHRVSGKMMEGLLSSNGLSLEEGESFNINVDVWCAVSVTGKNAEKARAIQDLLNTTPSNINWGLLLQRLPA